MVKTSRRHRVAFALFRSFPLARIDILSSLGLIHSPQIVVYASIRHRKWLKKSAHRNQFLPFLQFWATITRLTRLSKASPLSITSGSRWFFVCVLNQIKQWPHKVVNWEDHCCHTKPNKNTIYWNGFSLLSSLFVRSLGDFFVILFNWISIEKNRIAKFEM